MPRPLLVKWALSEREHGSALKFTHSGQRNFRYVGALTLNRRTIRYRPTIMKPKAHGTQVSTSQLELPLGKPGAAHDLAYYIGLGKVFAAYHKRWPTADATREEFRAARVKDVDGRRIERELRYPAPELEADPEYQALRERCLLDGMGEGVSLEALDPRYRTVLSVSGIAGLFASIALPVKAGPDAVRYATGLPAHAAEELTLRIGQGIAMRALTAAGFDPQDPRVLARSFSVRVLANDELKSVIDRIGIHRPSLDARLADHYLLDAGEDGRLTVRYQLLAGGRYAGRFDIGQLSAKLAAVYAADPELMQLRGTETEARATPAIPAAPAPGSVEELREQLAMLQPEGQSLKLPIQALSRFAEIRRLLEKAGGDYRPNRQQFDFEEYLDPAAVLAQLLKQLSE